MVAFKKFSLKSLVEQFGQSFKRFPVAMLLTLLLGCFLIYLVHGGSLGEKKDFFFVFYPATGAVLAIALSLITEDFKNRYLGVALQVVAHVLWVVASIYLSGFDRFSTPQMIAVSATVAAMSLAVFVACFFRRHQDVEFWNFSVRTVVALGLAGAIGGILTLGLNALVESLKMLFGIHISDKAFGDIAAVCMTMLAPALFMNLIPKGEDKHMNTVVEFSSFAKGVAQYLFIPLLALYMITLYVYAAKIVFQWMLPVGGVSYMVSASMLMMVLLIYLTYPIQHHEGNRVFKRITHWLPVIMLPLLALMTVAIWRRLSDYGITVSRLYLLVFNLWCYAVCLWLIFTRNKRIWIIPASFAVILLLISVGPQSISSVTLYSLKNEAREAFTASGLTQFPLSGDQYEKWLQSVDKKTASAIDSKLDYIQDFFRYESVKDLVGKDVVLGRIAKMDDENIKGNGYEYYSNWKMMNKMDIPAGAHSVEWIDMGDDCLADVKGEVMTVVLKTDNGNKQTFELNIKMLVARDQEKCQDQSPDPLVLQNGESVFVVNHFTLTVDDNKEVNSLNLEGLLFCR